MCRWCESHKDNFDESVRLLATCYSQKWIISDVRLPSIIGLNYMDFFSAAARRWGLFKGKGLISSYFNTDLMQIYESAQLRIVTHPRTIMHSGMTKVGWGGGGSARWESELSRRGQEERQSCNGPLVHRINNSRTLSYSILRKSNT
jgi:hypothetical protein